MKIDWKHLASTPGYRSLKASMIKTIKRDNRFSCSQANKVKTHLKFLKVIGRLQHLAHKQGVSMEYLLNFHESERGTHHSWDSYYSDFHLPKLGRPKNHWGINGIRRDAKRWNHLTPQDVKHRVCAHIQQEQKKASKKLKPRWTTAQKAFYAKHGFH